MAEAIISLSTAGIHMYYAAETESGTRPTEGWTDILGIKSTPALDGEPETLETTTLAETEFKTYIPGLKDLGGAMALTANLSQALMNCWDTLMTTFNASKKADKAVWFVVVIPGLEKACYFTGEPSPLGMPETEVNNVLEAQLYITPTNAPEWDTKPTIE